MNNSPARSNRFRSNVGRLATLLAVSLLATPRWSPAQSTTQPTTGPTTRPAVFKAAVVPQWLDASHFWYRNDLPGGAREFIYVDAAAGTRTPAFDAGRLAAALSSTTGQPFTADRLPVRIVARDANTVTIADKGVSWSCDLQSYVLSSAKPAVTNEPTTAPTRGPRRRRDDREPDFSRAAASPDGSHVALLREKNVFIGTSEDNLKQITTDGREGFAYERMFWSPDGKALVAYRMEPGDHLPVYRIESSPPGANATDGAVKRAVLHTDEYPLPGDKLDSYEMNLIDVEKGLKTKPKVDRIDANEWGSHPTPTVRWRTDGRHFTYEKYDRGHQRFRLTEVDSVTGDTRDLIDEKTETFIWTAHVEDLKLSLLNYLPGNKEVIYISERSGWRQLYLLDLDSGVLKPITSGEWVLRGIGKIDDKARQIWFAAGSVYPGQDPYLIQYGRVNFDGTGLTWLTDANGQHNIDFSRPNDFFSADSKYLVVTHSRVDLPPVTQLRRTDTGKLVVELERATVNGDWKPLEVFTAKARDGVTDIWGVISRPASFDPSKKYPIIENVYAGPQGAYVPKTFSIRSRYEDLNRRGFVVVQADGMGTAFRSKAFHDVCWKNLADAGFPDRIGWIKAAALKYPFMDIDHVGIYGTSAGGQSAGGAMIFHNDFYKAAVANCGCHDNRMDKISWNEQWMGWPVGPQYSASSNIDNASKLKGRLQLVLGELDDNVPVESTYRLVNALVQSGKEFEFVLVPGARHGAGSPITSRKLGDFFVRYLQGVEPQNPN